MTDCTGIGDGRRRRRTASEEAIFGEDGDRIGDENERVEELPEAEEEHFGGMGGAVLAED